MFCAGAGAVRIVGTAVRGLQAPLRPQNGGFSITNLWERTAMQLMQTGALTNVSGLYAVCAELVPANLRFRAESRMLLRCIFRDGARFTKTRSDS